MLKFIPSKRLSSSELSFVVADKSTQQMYQVKLNNLAWKVSRGKECQLVHTYYNCKHIYDFYPSFHCNTIELKLANGKNANNYKKIILSKKNLNPILFLRLAGV